MSRKHFSVEQIINHLREAEVLLAQGRKVGEICRQIGISEQSYYRWRQEYGGLKVDQARRLKELEQENGQLKRTVEEIELMLILLYFVPSKAPGAIEGFPLYNLYQPYWFQRLERS